MPIIDLRSDTVTQPTQRMRDAMYTAELGDDVYGEDPTVNKLQEMAAERMGMQAALFVPSGHMGNLLAFLAHCRRGDEVLLGNLTHPFTSETGSLAAVGGIQPHTLPNQPDGTLRLEDLQAALRIDDVHQPVSRVVSLENTHNRCNGVPLTAEYTQSVGQWAHANNLKLHIDGARIFNAAVALGVPAAALAAPADSITFCLSKGLCAPVGSVLCGSEEFIYHARRGRKQLGGGMRQAGILAAAGIVALEDMVDRLAEDHARAARLAAGLAELKQLSVPTPHTNIVRFALAPGASTQAEALQETLSGEGILLDYGRYESFRIVTHYWIDDAAVEKTLAAFKRAMSA
ncbi:MAG TPA: low-specificity L-threonine aldolase [Anaerolineales bacterium]|nr:low-specificity L-threonine aldolase [Anaerolineales bacterium]HRQ91977.1 low-specificity L-threonine aldolase [Anaerolineales bacterium]